MSYRPGGTGRGGRAVRPESCPYGGGKRYDMTDMTNYATAEITDTMAAFGDWLIEEVFGGKLPKGVDEASFRKGVALGGSTRGYFQKSEAWKNDPRNYLANVEANREKKATEKAERARAALVKAQERADAAVKAAEEAAAKAKAKAEAIAASVADAEADADADAEAA